MPEAHARLEAAISRARLMLRPRARVRNAKRWLRARWRAAFPTRLPEWSGPVSGAGNTVIMSTGPDGARVEVDTAAGLRAALLMRQGVDAEVTRAHVTVREWTRPWPHWVGRLGSMPGLQRCDLRLPATAPGPVEVEITLAGALPLRAILTAVLTVVTPDGRLPTTLDPLVRVDHAQGWLRPDQSEPPALEARPRHEPVRPYDIHLFSTPGTGPAGSAASLVVGPAGVASPRGGGAILVDVTANPRGREHYGKDLATGRIALTRSGDHVWWRITRPNEPTSVLVAGRVGDALDERQLASLVRLRSAALDEPPSADVPTDAVAAALATLAATGVVIHAPAAPEAATAALADDLVDIMGTPLPGHDDDELPWERRSVAQRRMAMRGHLAELALPRVAAGAFPALGRPPTVTALLVTRRPGRVVEAVDALVAQTYPELEIIVGVHGDELSPDVQARLAAVDRPVRVTSIPAGFNLGEALGEATRLAQGSLVTKVDDDDLYGPDHIWDLVLARCYSGATLVGKGAEFVYVEAKNATVRRRMGIETYTDVVAGGTMLISRGDLEAIGGWRPVERSIDRALLDRVLGAGGLVYRTHGFGFVYTRHAEGHTWGASVDYFMVDARRTWPGLARQD